MAKAKTGSVPAVRKRNSPIILEFAGEKKRIADWAAQFNLKTPTLYQRITKLGWTVERALNAPVREYGRLAAA